MFTKNFKELDKNDAAIAGGKGASLGEMTNSGIPVPPGFVVLAGAFEKFLKITDLNVEIESILATADTQKMHTVEKASERIQSLILGAKMPVDIEKEIQKEYRKLDAQFVAVRSSATAEDGAEAAWAGQLESYLNTIEKDLLKNVRRCWASLFTPRAIFYRFEKHYSLSTLPEGGIKGGGISVAVVIQKMIQSKKSGIAFSVHPVTQDYNQLIIEAGYGLGEAIVSGSITPDSYVVEKKPRKILDINISTQTKGLYRACHLDRSPSLDDLGRSGEISSNNEWQDIPEPQASSQVLNKKEILELSDLIIKIENHYGFPCDIEWALEDGKFYITQSRPITTLIKKKVNSKDDYVKIFNRALYVIACQNYDLGERVELKKVGSIGYFMDPVFSNLPSKGTGVYYNFTDPKQDPKPLIEYFNGNRKQLAKIKEVYYNDCDLLRDLIDDSKYNNYQKLFDLTIKIWPMVAVSNMLGDNRNNIKGVDKDLIKLYRKMRKYSDGLIHNSHLKIAKIVKEIVPKKYKDYYKYLKYEEVVNNNYPEIKELKDRMKGYIFHKGKLYADMTLDEYARKNNYKFIGFEKNEDVREDVIFGQIAYKGKAIGRVKIVLETEDVDKVEEGDILVASMTTPDFIVAMEKAGAFVTDEGGITCHAAIVAREFKKPCVIGTKIATQVLRDGDLVEADAERGIVKILEKVDAGSN